MKKILLFFLLILNWNLAAQQLYISEKMYVQTDRSQYIAGDTLWFKTYCFDAGNHILSQTSGVAYVSLVDEKQKVIGQKKLLLKSGQAYNDFILPNDLAAGSYQLVAHTNLMRNFDESFYFHKQIDVLSKENKKNKESEYTRWAVQFFPEGGDLIEGVTNRMAFKATNQFGKGIEIEGVIKDENDNLINEFKTVYLGMGTLSFSPEQGKKYHAVVTFQGQSQRLELPKIQTQGYALIADNVRFKQGVFIQISSPKPNKQKLLLMAQMRGNILFEAELNGQKAVNKVLLPNDKIPEDGIVHLTLFDEKRIPLAERLVFVNQNRKINLTVKSNKTNLKSREEVSFEIQVTNTAGQPIETNLSMAITDANQVVGNSQSPNIRTYLLLNSDLKGVIEKPNAYFELDSIPSKIYLDNLMLTHGWRRFDWKTVQQNEMPFSIEKNMILAGKAYGLANKLLKNEALKLAIWTEKGMQIKIAQTDAEGYFELPNMWADSVWIVAGDSKGREASIRLDEAIVRFQQMPSFEASLVDSVSTQKFVENSELMHDLAIDAIRLDEVVVKEKRIDPAKNDSRRIMYGGTPDASVVITEEMRSGATSVLQMLEGRIVGIRAGTIGQAEDVAALTQVATAALEGVGNVGQIGFASAGSGNGGSDGGVATPATSASLANGVLILLDGVRVPAYTLSSLQPQDIERVDVLRTVQNTAIFGIAAGNGRVINILTRRWKDWNPNTFKNKKHLKLNGYVRSREFYSPVYKNTNVADNLPDRRATLYWNPEIKTDETGKAYIKFYNSDIAKKLQIIVEGTDGKGNLGSKVVGF